MTIIKSLVELDDCPFCGDTPDMEKPDNEGHDIYCVTCENCNISMMNGSVGIGWYSSQQKAADDWNRRA